MEAYVQRSLGERDALETEIETEAKTHIVQVIIHQFRKTIKDIPKINNKKTTQKHA